MKRLFLGILLFTACSSGSSKVQAPVISSFTAKPATINAGQSSTLSWSISGSESISTRINQGVGDVSASSIKVSPNSTTTYTLSASSKQGTDTQDVTVAVQNSSPAGLPAFPGAEGFGASATGGRGGKVIYVTNLNASGAGSLQAALDEAGLRTILFKVSGVIEGVPIAQHGDFTLAGQSSPGGIILRGFMLQGDVVCEDDNCPLPTVFPENFIVRFLRIRNPLPDGSDGDGVRLHHAKLGIIDHVSIGGATDESMQISFSSDITVQNTMLAEALGEHAYLAGMLMNYGDPARGFPETRISIHHNLWNRILGRMPEIGRDYEGNNSHIMELELSNNVLYDHAYPIWIANTSLVNYPQDGYNTDPIYYHANIVGNLSIQNSARSSFEANVPGGTVGVFTMEGAGPASNGYLPTETLTRFFMEDNQTNLHPDFKDFQLFYCCNDFAQTNIDGLTFPDNTASFKQFSRFDFPAINYTPSSALLSYVLANVGAFPRDDMDSRLLSFVERGEFDTAPRDTNPANDALNLVFTTPPTAPIDTDNDGMPDDWESTHGLNPNAADGTEVSLSKAMTGIDGYTNLEVYLDDLAKLRMLP